MADPTNGTVSPGQGAPATGQAPDIQELAEYKQFFEGVTPLLAKLDANPALVEAIMGDKLSADFAKAALEGKLTVQEAQAAVAAVAEVKNDVGAAAFANMDVDTLTKLVDGKVDALKTELTARDDMRSFEQYTSDFIANTADFENYSKDISAWLDEHDVTDIKVAYYAVKGELSEKEAKERATQDAAEQAKNFVLSAASGGAPATARIEDPNIIDSLIASRVNPNRL